MAKGRMDATIGAPYIRLDRERQARLDFARGRCCKRIDSLGRLRGLTPAALRVKLLVESCVGTVSEFFGLLCRLNECTHKTKALLEIEGICLLASHAALLMGQTHYQMPVDVYSNFKRLKIERCDALSMQRHIVALHRVQ